MAHQGFKTTLQIETGAEDKLASTKSVRSIHDSGNSSKKSLVSPRVPNAQIDGAFSGQKQATEEAFFQNYTSYLRVESRVGALVNFKRHLQKKGIVDRATPEMYSDRSKSMLTQPSKATLISIQNEVDRKASAGKWAPFSSSRTSMQLHQRAPVMQKGEVSLLNDSIRGGRNNDYAASNSLHALHSHSPQAQFLLGLAQSKRNSVKLQNQSMVHGANVKLEEERFFKQVQSPTGPKLQYYAPGGAASKEAVVYQQHDGLINKRKGSLINLLADAESKATESRNDTNSCFFLAKASNKLLTVSSSPPGQLSTKYQSIFNSTRFLKGQDSHISVRLKDAQIEEQPLALSPKALLPDLTQARSSLYTNSGAQSPLPIQNEALVLKLAQSVIDSDADNEVQSVTYQFDKNTRFQVQHAQKISPDKPVKLQSISQQKVHQLPEQTGLATPVRNRALSKQLLSNECLIQKYKARANSVAAIATTDASKLQPNAVGSALRNPKLSVFASRSQSQEPSALQLVADDFAHQGLRIKKGDSRINLLTNLNKFQNAETVSRLDRQAQVVQGLSDKFHNLNERHWNMLESTKFCREMTPVFEGTRYREFGGQKELGIDAVQAVEAIEQENAIDPGKALSAQLTKAYADKLKLSSDCMLNQIWKQVGSLKATNEVLEWQQRLQRKGTSLVAFKDFFEVKEAYHRMLRQKEERMWKEEQARGEARRDPLLRAGPGRATTGVTTTEYDGTTNHDRTTNLERTTNVDGTTVVDGGTTAVAGTTTLDGDEAAPYGTKQTLKASTGEPAPDLGRPADLAQQASEPGENMVAGHQLKEPARKAKGPQRKVPLSPRRLGSGKQAQQADKMGKTQGELPVPGADQTLQAPGGLGTAKHGLGQAAVTLPGGAGFGQYSKMQTFPGQAEESEECAADRPGYAIRLEETSTEEGHAVPKQPAKKTGKPSPQNGLPEHGEKRLDGDSDFERLDGASDEEDGSAGRRPAGLDQILGHPTVEDRPEGVSRRGGPRESILIGDRRGQGIEVIQLDGGKRRKLKKLHESETSDFETDADLQSDSDSPLITEKGLSGSSAREPSISASVAAAGIVLENATDPKGPEMAIKMSERFSSPLISKNEEETFIAPQHAALDSSILSEQLSESESEGEQVGTQQPFTEKTSCDSQGVHKLIFTGRNFGNKKGGTIYKMLKADAFVLIPTREKAVLSYDQKDRRIRDFIHYCEATYSTEAPIGPYPLLHQLLHGRLVVKNRNYEPHTWPELLDHAEKCSRSPSILNPFNMIYIENCEIPDWQMAQFVAKLISIDKIQEVYFSKMDIGPRTLSTVTMVQQKRARAHGSLADFCVFFKKCNFVGFELNTVPTHVALEKLLQTLKNLTLTGVELDDEQLPTILERIYQLDSLDISYNNFRPKALHKFITQVNKQKNSEMHLSSISIKGNSLREKNALDTTLQRTLSDLILKPYLQHLDIGCTNLTFTVVRTLIQSLKYSRSMMSLHLCSPLQKKFRQIAMEVMGNLLFDRRSLVNPKEEIPQDWNEQFNVPHAQQVDITPNVQQAIVGLEMAQQYSSMKILQQLVAARFKPNKNVLQDLVLSDYTEQRYVISRIIGRDEHSNHYDPVLGHSVTGAEINLTDNLEEEFKRDLVTGKRRLDEICWIESEECWICARHSAYLTIVTKDDMIQCCHEGQGDVFKNLQKLNDTQERVFDKLVHNAGADLSKVEVGVPYLIGPMTNLKWTQMRSLGDFMLKIDPDGNKVRLNCGSDKTLLHDAYKDCWHKVLKNSYDFGRNINRKNLTAIQKQHLKTSLYPYMPHIDRHPDEKFDEDDICFTYMSLTKPGRGHMFVYCKLNGSDELKAQITTDIPIRTKRIHKHMTPKVRDPKIDILAHFKTKDDEKLDEATTFFNNIFLNWSRSVNEWSLRNQFNIDTTIWSLKMDEAIYNRTMSSQKSQIKDELLDQAQIIFTTYRHLQSHSETYPLLNYRQMCEFVKGIDFIDNNYSFLPFMAAYELIKAPENIKKVQRKTFLKKRMSSKAVISYPDPKNKKKEVKEDPKNLMHRFHFIELLVKISTHKFGYKLHPHESLRRMIAENIQPSMKSKALYGANEPREVLTKRFFNNEKVCRLLFLNQFGLKQIYDAIAATVPLPATPVKGKLMKSLSLRDSTGSIGSKDLSPKKMRKSLSLDKMVQLDGSPTSKKNQSIDSEPKSPAIIKRRQTLNLKLKSLSKDLAVTDFNNQNNKESPKTGVPKKLDQPNSPTFLAQPESAVPNNPYSPLKQHRQGSLKKLPMGSPQKKKGVNVRIVTEEKKEEIQPPAMVTYDHLYTSMHQVFGKDIQHKLSPQMFRWLYTHSKMPQTSSGNTIEQIEYDKQDALKIKFSEVIVFICLMAFKLKASLMLDAGLTEQEGYVWLEKPYEWVKSLLEKIMPAFNQEVQFDANEGTINLITNTKPIDILLGGEIQDYKPSTPERFRESNFGSMFSEMTQQPEQKAAGLQRQHRHHKSHLSGPLDTMNHTQNTIS